MQKKRTIFRVGIGLGMVVLVTGSWLLSRDSEVTSQRLPDGSILSLVGVTYGRKHVLVTGPVWQRMLTRLLPDRAVQRLGLPVFTHATTNDSLMVWTELRDQVATRSPTGGYTAMPVTIVDRHGNEFAQTGAIWRRQTTNSLIEGILFNVVPRGADQLRVRILPRDNLKQTEYSAEFTTRNPAPNIRSKWRDAPLPVEVRAGDLSLRLTDLTPIRLQGPRSRRSGDGTWTRASYLIAEAGVVTTNWRVMDIEVFDESGGRYMPPVSTAGSADSFTRVEFRGSLGTNAVWKLRFTLDRVGGFLPDELWVARGFLFAIAGVTNARPVSTQMHGRNLTLLEGPRSLTRSVRLLVSPKAEGLGVRLLQAIDERGEDVKIRNVGGGNSAIPTFALTDRSGSRSVNLTFAVTRLHYVEMLVRPTTVLTNAAVNVP